MFAVLIARPGGEGEPAVCALAVYWKAVTSRPCSDKNIERNLEG